ncbi:hypothetical protein D3C81_2314900 [compost metagenome]
MADAGGAHDDVGHGQVTVVLCHAFAEELSQRRVLLDEIAIFPAGHGQDQTLGEFDDLRGVLGLGFDSDG